MYLFPPIIIFVVKIFSHGLLSNYSHAMSRFIIVHTDKDQVFDNEINHKRYVENLLRFLNNNIVRGRTGKILDDLHGSLLYWIIENPNYFKNEKK